MRFLHWSECTPAAPVVDPVAVKQRLLGLVCCLKNGGIWHSFLKAKVQTHEGPTVLSVLIVKGLEISHKHPAGASIIPWNQRRNVAWGVTVNFAASYLPNTSVL